MSIKKFPIILDLSIPFCFRYAPFSAPQPVDLDFHRESLNKNILPNVTGSPYNKLVFLFPSLSESSSFIPANLSWHPPPVLPPPAVLKAHDHPLRALSIRAKGKSCENEDVSSNLTLCAWSLGSYYAPFASLHWLWWKEGKEAMTGQKRGPSWKHILFGVFFFSFL